MDQLIDVADLRSTYKFHWYEAKKRHAITMSDELLKHLLTNLVHLKDHLFQKLKDKCTQAVSRRDLYEPFFAFFTTIAIEGSVHPSWPKSSTLLLADGTSQSLSRLLRLHDVLSRVRTHLGPSFDVAIRQETIKTTDQYYIVREKLVLEFFPDRTGSPSKPIPEDLRVHSRITL